MTASNQDGYPGQQSPASDSSRFNEMAFLIKQMLALCSTATLVQVQSVTATGEVGPVGTVSVQPLVNLVDGIGNASPHGVINNVPYFRMQGGGGKAIILDPKVGDIGIAIFADRDISSVKRNKARANPGSKRRFDMADALYIGGYFGPKPTSYVRFTDDGQIICAVGESDPCELVVAADHVQMKKVGNLNLHVTIDVATSQIIMGMNPIIASDPFPGS